MILDHGQTCRLNEINIKIKLPIIIDCVLIVKSRSNTVTMNFIHQKKTN